LLRMSKEYTLGGLAHQQETLRELLMRRFLGFRATST
jgi:hypothetical protein